MVAIETAGLTKYYGKVRGVENLDLSVEAGEVFGYLDPNGAGKTTTIRMLLGLLSPTSGHATLLGHDVTVSGGTCGHHRAAEGQTSHRVHPGRTRIRRWCHRCSLPRLLGAAEGWPPSGGTRVYAPALAIPFDVRTENFDQNASIPTATSAESVQRISPLRCNPADRGRSGHRLRPEFPGTR